jgi:SMODS-associating 4TM effector domain
MHNILSNQNKPENLLRLAAQRQLYKEAKRYVVIQILITVPVTIILSFLKLIPADTLGFDIVGVAAFFGTVISIADYLIGQFLVSNYKCKAAKVQEEFDCDVYEMTWDKISVGSRIPQELVNEYGRKYKEIPGSPLVDWYPVEIAGLSKEKAIFICQKTNLYYDKSLRNKYIWTTSIVSIIILGIIITTSLIGNPSLGDFMVRVFAPFLPVLILSLRIVIEHFKSAKALSELHTTVSGLPDSTAGPSIPDLRLVQTKIFTSRKDSPLVPDFFYNKKRKKLEDTMHQNAKQV